MKVHILDDWFDTLGRLPSFERLNGHEVTVWNDHEPDPNRLADRLRDAQVLVLFRERTAVGADLLDRLPNLRLISQRSVYPHIDVESCTRNGVLLCSNLHAGSPSFATAEHTFALMLASYRQIPQQVQSVRAGNWQMGVGRSLRGRRLALYGYGRIAKAVAGYAEAFGMNVTWWGSKDGRERAASDGAAVAANRMDFFSTADIVSLHVRLKPATMGIITRRDLAAMQPRSLLVNTSRSGIIETGALEEEVVKGRILAAVDVFDTEPMHDTGHTLLCSPNVLPTPHIGFVTEDELDLQFTDIYDQINAFASGQPKNVINTELLEGGNARNIN